MRVDFSFNENLVKASGYTMEDIYGTVKNAFAEKCIPCIADGSVLSFGGGVGENDFSNMWAVILRLTKSDWFLNFATSCVWREDDDKWEDVLRQVKAKQKKRA